MPAAVAAAAPPDDPPGVRSVSQGLRAGPKRRGSLTGRIPNSGMFVLPTITKPASRSRRTTNASCSGTKSPNMSEPIVSGMPATAAVSLTAIGTPAKGRGSPEPTASAAASAPSGSRWTNAFNSGWSASMRCRQSSTSSRELSSPLRTRPASSPAGLNISSDTGETLRDHRDGGCILAGARVAAMVAYRLAR